MEEILMAKQEKYQKLAEEIITLVGGKDNVTFFTHCITRLRFNLKDKGLVDEKGIEAAEGVVGLKWSGEQLQIIIGTDVADAYNLICRVNGMREEKAVDENLDGGLKGKKKFSINAVIDGISGCITPLLPMLVGSGMLKVIMALLIQFKIMEDTASTYQVLSFVSDAAFYFLPVAIGITGAKKFGVNMSVGLMLGAALIHPNFIAMVNGETAVTFLGISVYAKTYSSTVFPMVLTMWICGYVERFIAKHSPKVLRSVLEPFLTIIIMAPLMLCLIAPLGSIVGNYLTEAMLWLYGIAGPIYVPVMAALFPLLVITGMHTSFIPFTTERFATVGYDPFLGVPQVIANINQGVACLVVALKTKNVDLKSVARTSGITAMVAGTTEPALFGITLKYKTPLIAAMIGSFCGGIWGGINGCVRYAYGGNSLLTLPVFIGEIPSNFINVVISVIIGMAATFIATMILYKPEKAETSAES